MGPKGGRPQISSCFSLSRRKISFFLLGVLSWNCGRVSRPRSTQTARLGFSDINLCEPGDQQAAPRCYFLLCFVYGASLCPRGIWSHQAPEPCNWIFAERRYLPSFVHRGIHVGLPRVLCSYCVFLIGTIVVLFQQLVVHGRSMVVASRLTPPVCSRFFGFGTALSSLLPPCGRRRESLLRQRLVHRARSRVWQLVHHHFLQSTPFCVKLGGKNSTLLCGSSFMHNGCECATRCVRLVV